MKLTKLLLLSLLLTFAQQSYSQTIDTLIDIGKYKLHFKVIKGKGNPILFETGGGNDMEQLDTLLKPIFKATSATLIIYDRQGFGKSGLDMAHYSIENEIKGLELGINKLGYDTQPMLLACHSLGGFYSVTYASRHPQLVKGIVMLDPRIAGYSDMILAKKVFRAIDNNLISTNQSLYYVLSNMERNSNYVRKLKLAADIHILDIMAERGPFDSVVENTGFKERQEHFVKQYPNAVLKHTKGTTHNIPQDHPQLAVESIVGLYKQIMVPTKGSSK
jgi:pimeloyl-ACP methyl ester carboxylesterase